MEYHEAANFLFDLQRFRPKPGTESTADLLAHLGNPHDGVAYIQVAGSNGKGSTARMVESILREHGLDVGLYTSPHIDDLRERVQVDGRKISKAAIRKFVEIVRPYVNERIADGEAPTFFETTTALALWQFGRRDVDVAVLEVGIGGKYDATSVVTPTASAVTSVTLEHTGIIGETIEEIARDKAHVAPPNNPLVTAATGEALDAVREQAGDVLTVGEGGDIQTSYGGRVNHTEAAVSLAGDGWSLDARIPLVGEYQARNAGIAVALARQFAPDLQGEEEKEAVKKTIARGLRKAFWPGRFEVMDTDPLVVLDGAHNPGACEALAAAVAEFDYDDLHLVAGVMHDKDLRRMAQALPTPDAVYACQPDLDRAEDEDVVATVFEEEGARSTESIPAVEDAVERAIATAGPDDAVLITGSLYTVAEARPRWTRLEVPKRVRDLGEATDALADADVPDLDIQTTSENAVHRVLKTRIRERQARLLRDAFVGVGGECAVSGLAEQEAAYLDVVLMGTLAQFEQLLERLTDQPHGLAVLANDLRATLGLDSGEDDDVCNGYPWQDGTAVMGILNVTPDSFHDGGAYDTREAAVAHAKDLVAEGAEIIDVGGESTRPGADPVTPDEEEERVVPVIEAIADLDALISVDTRRAAVARAALEAGADIVNDVSGLADPEMRFVVAEHDAGLVVMHSIDAPVVPGRNIEYDDVVEDVLDALGEKVLLAEKAGLDRDQIVVDPGIGFGKSAAESFELLGRIGEFQALGCPVLVGHSHKSMYEFVGCGPGERGPATVAGTALAVEGGADIVRVHDVAENVAAVRVARAARSLDSYEDDRE